MKKFLVLFLTPVSVMENWMKKDPDERKEKEESMGNDWERWTNNYRENIIEIPSGAGQTKVIDRNGISDAKNDIMMFTIVQADSYEEASAMFINHPHLEIDDSSIQVMSIKTL